MVRQLNGYANANPEARDWTEYLAKSGDTELWLEFAKQYRRQVGFVRGWMGTGLMAATMGVTALATTRAKRHYRRLRPYQIDGMIQPIGKAYTDASYPSGHSSVSSAAATVLGNLWPARAYEFRWWANQVAMSRMAAGMHFPSDVRVGAELGARIGATAASILY